MGMPRKERRRGKEEAEWRKNSHPVSLPLFLVNAEVPRIITP